MFENIPKPIFLLSTTAKIEILGKKIEKDNLMALDWFMPVSHEPAKCAIAIKQSRFTYRMIKESNVFTLNLMPASKKKEIIICACLLYTSDAADDLLCVDLGGRRIIKKKKTTE